MGYSFQDLGDGSYRVSGVRISPTTGKYITGPRPTLGVQKRETYVWLCEGCHVWSDSWFDNEHDAQNDYLEHLIDYHD